MDVEEYPSTDNGISKRIDRKDFNQLPTGMDEVSSPLESNEIDILLPLRLQLEHIPRQLPKKLHVIPIL